MAPPTAHYLSPNADFRTQWQLRVSSKCARPGNTSFSQQAWMGGQGTVCPPSRIASLARDGPNSEFSGGMFCEMAGPLGPRTNKESRMMFASVPNSLGRPKQHCLLPQATQGRHGKTPAVTLPGEKRKRKEYNFPNSP